ncbi:hypothetical protein [Pseudomonas sp. PD9R]|uniref:hypothetical protein n=1 Tax=Pseudomonas sp. PD9R TaxID=2853534 RepID=UPI001C446EF4|nr:hypothetical protein [Pseudomonas sp. PD9R]MBV6823853.1 hypothetical protein [Pseudomonas sp. PD9R]
MANTPTVTLRLPADITARVDAYAKSVEAETGVEVTRTAALKALVIAGLESKEKRKK